jgi:serine/threonine-protein kinase
VEALLGGRYRLLESLGAGGMGEVWRARALGPASFEREVAIKMSHPSFSRTAETRELLIEEARLTARLIHPNIAQITELGVSDGRYFIVMEYVPGTNARRLIDAARARSLRIDPALACFIAAEVAAGLHYAHEALDPSNRALNLIHRDVSPGNCLLSFAGEVKLCDFGIAKTEAAEATRGLVLKGKLRYMSPEQSRGMRLDRTSDIFSLGAVLYELLTFEPCFDGKNDEAILEAVRAAEVTPTGVSAEIDGILKRALAPDRKDRYATAREMREALLAVLPKADHRAQLAAIVAKLASPRPPPAPSEDDCTFDVDEASMMIEASPPAPPERNVWAFWIALTLLFAPVLIGIAVCVAVLITEP